MKKCQWSRIWDCFTVLVKSRYLMIIGGNEEPQQILFCDIKDNFNWGISCQKIPQEIDLTDSSGCACLLKNEKDMYVMGMGMLGEAANMRLLIQMNIKWQCERQIWIAFYKNEKNNLCFIDKLPKDVVFKILDYLRNSLPFFVPVARKKIVNH